MNFGKILPIIVPKPLHLGNNWLLPSNSNRIDELDYSFLHPRQVVSKRNNIALPRASFRCGLFRPPIVVLKIQFIWAQEIEGDSICGRLIGNVFNKRR
ncbi:hypothetical protein SAMN05216387_107147 [Nitrosovibrio tenuis]|uniref:Uncharacterized protein n=1 Tax=Nitrosovibrio tenuis TaxID=1233 RepID=A0A1H7NV43_9PROT|nr:hypothetical protein SAMN05216387_107147 [Nitrosovibrio tenuis]